MKMKIWIEEAMKEMVEEVEKNEPMPKHWKRSVLLFCLLSAVCFQTGLLVLAKNGIASADRSPLFIATGIVCSMLVGVVLIKCCLYAKRIMNAYFDGVNYVCPDCGREWPCDEIADDDDDNDKLRCPECGSHLVYPDSSGINDYACDACGCRWDGDDDDYDEDYDDDEEED